MNLVTAASDVCRLCAASSNTLVFQLPRMPKWNHRLLVESELAADRSIELAVYRCSACGFISLPLQLQEDYYEEYVNTPSLSPQMREFQRAEAAKFVERFSLGGKALLEVGCGDGFFLEALAANGAVCRGVEPSSLQRAIALNRGLQVEAGVLRLGAPLVAGPFDAFATRQVLEHVEDIRGFLLAIRENLRVGAVGLIEVPSLELSVREGRFFDFIPEHVNYFSQDSLRLALQLVGFDVIEIVEVCGGESIRAYVRLPSCGSFDRVEQMASEIRVAMASFIGECKARGERVAIWGAGGKGLGMLAAADVTGVDMLVDFDPNKQGRYTPVSHLKVAPVEALRDAAIGAIIITAPTYQYEILRVLRDTYHFKGKVALIEGTLRVIQ